MKKPTKRSPWLWLAGLLLVAACGDSGGDASSRDDQPLPSTERWMWPQTSMLGMDFDVDAKVAATWIPSALRLADPPTATLFVASYPNSGCCGPYGEAAVLFHVVHDGAEKLHCAWMVVDDDVAMVLGRDVLGYPKKMASISLEVKKGRLLASVAREGTTVIDAEGRLGAAVDDPPPLIGGKTVNVWGIYHPYIPTAPLPQLLSFSVGEEILSATAVDLDVRIGGSEGDPLDELGLRGMRSATLYSTNMGGGGGALVLGEEVDLPFLYRTYQLRNGNVQTLAPTRP